MMHRYCEICNGWLTWEQAYGDATSGRWVHVAPGKDHKPKVKNHRITWDFKSKDNVSEGPDISRWEEEGGHTNS